jgi:hypothetical protein
MVCEQYTYIVNHPTPIFMPRVYPSSTTMTWIEEVQKTIDVVQANNAIPHKYNTVQRYAGRTCCLTTCCSPCLIWSTVFRILCCPVSCMQGHTCLSNNGCTDPSDNCIRSTWNAFGEKIAVEGVETRSGDEIKAVLIYAHNKIKDTKETRTKYLIADYMLPVVKQLARHPTYAIACVHMFSGDMLKTLTPHDIEGIAKQLEFITSQSSAHAQTP